MNEPKRKIERTDGCVGAVSDFPLGTIVLRENRGGQPALVEVPAVADVVDALGRQQ